MTKLETLVRNHIHFGHRPNAKGWLPILCKVCNDHGKKGPRAAFLFTPTSVSYHCFNCTLKASYTEGDSELSESMLKVLTSFMIPQDQIDEVSFELFASEEGKTRKPRAKRELDLSVQEVKMPSCCVPLKDVEDENPWKQLAELYLSEVRGIEPNSYPFYLGFEQPNDLASKKWDKRLIIPSYKNGMLVYYEGRDLTDTKAKKYVSAAAPKTNVLYGFDLLHTNTEKPLFVCEGFFDAFLINGVALFGNTLYKEIIHILNQSPRQKIIVPDRQGNGYKLAEHAINLGWSISIPDTPGCKDVNAAILKYGKLYVIKSIMDNICDGFEAQMKINMFLKD